MRKAVLLFFLFLVVSCSQEPTAIEFEKVDKIEIDKNWKFQKGSESQWKTIDFDDSYWDTIQVGKSWEKQGFEEYDGIGVYRKTIVISSDIKEQINEEYPKLKFCLGKIDDSDKVFFNGKLVGSMGDFVNKSNSYTEQREYMVPIELINWDAKNVIAVIVNDFEGEGGMYKGPYYYSVASWSDFVKVQADLESETGIIEKGQNAKFISSFSSKIEKDFEGQITHDIKKDTYEEISTNSYKFTLSAGFDANYYEYEYKIEEPGFYTYHISLQVPGQGIISDSVIFGYDPANIQTGTSRPDDFEAYWDEAKAALAKVEPKYELRLDEEWSNQKLDVYEVTMESFGNITIRGWYSVPKEKEGKLPVLIKNIGYSGTMLPVTDRSDFAVFALNIRGHGNSRDDIDPGFPMYITHNIDNKKDYIYRGAYMDVVRAVDFVCSREEVDTSRIGIYGGSQGGALSFAGAALDSRIDLCAPHVPFLSDFRAYFKIVPFVKARFEEYLGENSEFSWDDVYSTLDYVDVRNLTPWINVPVYMGVGLQDRICPPHINFAAFNNVTCQDKQWFVWKEHAHSVSDEHHKNELEWFRKNFSEANE